MGSVQAIQAWLLARAPRRWTIAFARRFARPGTLLWQPPPPVVGNGAAGRRLAGGVLVLDGHAVEVASGGSPWDVDPPSTGWAETLHGFSWLDDAAAADDPAAIATGKRWFWEWLDRFGDGTGTGWTPDLSARRMTRLIVHSTTLLQGGTADRSRAYFETLGTHLSVVSTSWVHTAPGRPRIEALTGLVYAKLSLESTRAETERSIAQLARTLDATISEDGSIASRNPWELATILRLTTWCADTIRAAEMDVPARMQAALARAAQTVSGLRHSTGDVFRCHGGGSLADHPASPPDPEARIAMGFASVACSRSTLMMDVAPPPAEPHRRTAHASALAIEFHCEGLPILVNAGPGSRLGEERGRAARQARAHSTILLAGRGPGGFLRTRDTGPLPYSARGQVRGRVSQSSAGAWVLGESDLYENRLGLIIERRLHLAKSGHRLSGEETVLARDAASRKKIAEAFPADGPACEMSARFLLHPDVDASQSLSGRTVSLTMPDQSLWLFRTDSEWTSLETAEYYDETRPKPRATLVIVATSSLLEYWGRMTWSLERLSH